MHFVKWRISSTFASIFLSLSKKRYKKFPKELSKLKKIIDPYFVRFTESGFNRDNILKEYFEKVLLPWKNKAKKEIVIIMDQAGPHTSYGFTKYLDSLQLSIYIYLLGYTCVAAIGRSNKWSIES